MASGVDVIADEPSAAGVSAAGASAGVDASVVSDVLGQVNNMVATQFQGGLLRTQMQTQPCSAAGFIREIMTTVLTPKMEWRHGWTDRAEAFLGDWVRESLQRQGRAGGGLHNGKSLARFMLEAGPTTVFGSELIPLGPRALLLGWLPEAQWLERGHLPTGAELASGAWRNGMSASPEVRQNGERLASGIYLYPNTFPDPERVGSKLRGPGVRSLIEQWIEYQIANVSGDDFGSLQGPRKTLAKMVGTYRGTGPFGLWRREDGASPGSRVYQIDLLWSDAADLLDTASDLCDEQWGLTQQLTERGQSLTEAQILADIELKKKEAARRDKIVIGGLAVVALFALTQ